MIASGSAIIKAPIEKIWEFVLDPNSYPQADTKITLLETLDQSDREMRSKVAGFLRWPFLRSSLIIKQRLRPYERIDIESEPGTSTFPGNLALERFRAEFIFEKEGDAVKVTHVENYETKDNALGRLAEGLAGDWLKRQLQLEMERLKALLEGQEPPTRLAV